MTLRLASGQSALSLVGSGYPQPVSHLGFAPGQIVTIQVVGMKAISPLFTIQRATAIPLPVTLAGISVTLKQSVINSRHDNPVTLPPHSAVLLSVGQSDLCRVAPIPSACLQTSIELQIPFELSFNMTNYPEYTTQMVISQDGVDSQPFIVSIVDDWIHVITCADKDDSTACGSSASFVTHADGTLVSSQSTAKPGEVVVIWAWGLGPTLTSVATGHAAPEPAPIPSLGGSPSSYGVPVRFVFGPNAAPSGLHEYPPSWRAMAFLTPGQVGLYQVNVQLPAVFPEVPPCNPLAGLVSNLTINLLLGASYDAALICVQPPQ
jgi:hypothetical protein